MKNLEDLIDEYKVLMPINKEYQRNLDEKFRLEFNYNSNHLEGNTLTYVETKALLLKNIAPANNKNYQELEEMKGHDVAYQLITEWAKDHERDLTEQDIRDLNQLILVKPFWKDAITQEGTATRRLIRVGEYKEEPNSVRLDNGEIFEYTSPLETPIKMRDLIDWFHSEGKSLKLSPVELAALFHYKFVRIHPFDDGNGRLSRLLLNYVLLRNDLPPVVIKTADKKNYLNALRLADAGDIKSFITYIQNQLKWSLEKAILAAKGENIEDPDDIDKEIDLLKKKLKSKESENVIERNDEVIFNLYENGFKNLFETLKQKLSGFDELFTYSETSTQLNGNTANFDFLATGMEEWKIEHLKKSGTTKETTRIWYKMGFGKSLNGFTKNGLDTFNCHISLELTFEQFQYKITAPNAEPLKKLYSSNLSEEEIELITKNCVRSILNQIKTQTSLND